MKRGLVPRLIGVGSLAAAAYAFVIRPWMLAWGSTVAERTRPLPGDEIEPDAIYVTTRAVTIKAPRRRSGRGCSRWAGDPAGWRPPRRGRIAAAVRASSGTAPSGPATYMTRVRPSGTLALDRRSIGGSSSSRVSFAAM